MEWDGGPRGSSEKEGQGKGRAISAHESLGSAMMAKLFARARWLKKFFFSSKRRGLGHINCGCVSVGG